MSGRNEKMLADQLACVSVKLTRWLRAADPAPRLSGPQASVLGVIIYSGGIKPSDLATLEEVKRPTIARTISELADRGLVRRIPSMDDARSVTIEATGEGRTLFAAGQAKRIKPLAAVINMLSTSEREILGSALDVLEQIVENADIPRR